jgi:hypothetical protein
MSPPLTRTDRDIRKIIDRTITMIRLHHHRQSPTTEITEEKRGDEIIHPPPPPPPSPHAPPPPPHAPPPENSHNQSNYNPEGVGINQRDSLLALGLPANSSEREIKTRFRRLSLIYHPDKYSPLLGITPQQATAQ